MSTFARMDSGLVVEIIEPYFSEDGTAVPIEELYTSEFVAELVDITDLSPKPVQGWTYDGTKFSTPVPWQPAPAEVLASNTATRDYFLTVASLAVAPLQDAVDLGEATDDEVVLLKKWKQYRVAVNRIDLTVTNPQWPDYPTLV